MLLLVDFSVWGFSMFFPVWRGGDCCLSHMLPPGSSSCRLWGVCLNETADGMESWTQSAGWLFVFVFPAVSLLVSSPTLIDWWGLRVLLRVTKHRQSYGSPPNEVSSQVTTDHQHWLLAVTDPLLLSEEIENLPFSPVATDPKAHLEWAKGQFKKQLDLHGVLGGEGEDDVVDTEEGNQQEGRLGQAPGDTGTHCHSCAASLWPPSCQQGHISSSAHLHWAWHQCP